MPNQIVLKSVYEFGASSQSRPCSFHVNHKILRRSLAGSSEKLTEGILNIVSEYLVLTVGSHNESTRIHLDSFEIDNKFFLTHGCLSQKNFNK